MLPTSHSTDAVLNNLIVDLQLFSKLQDLAVEIQLLNTIFMDSLIRNDCSVNHQEIGDRAVEIIRTYLQEEDFNISYDGENAMFYIAGRFSPTFRGNSLYKLIRWLKYIIG